MKIFLSALDTKNATFFIEHGCSSWKWNLLSYFQFRKRTSEFELIRDHSEEILIDSGAHSFQKGKQVDWFAYTKEYAEFIKKYDCPKVIGYFEMDVDNIIGYKNVLALRTILEQVSNKIIPVWHKNRGIDDFKQMCQKYAGKIIAITGFKNEDIRDDQYVLFLRYAKKFGCKIHCLGMTRTKVLDRVPFDYTDSASWKLQVNYGKVYGKKQTVTRQTTKEHLMDMRMYNYKQYMKLQEFYYQKWKRVCKD